MLNKGIHDPWILWSVFPINVFDCINESPILMVLYCFKSVRMKTEKPAKRVHEDSDEDDVPLSSR